MRKCEQRQAPVPCVWQPKTVKVPFTRGAVDTGRAQWEISCRGRDLKLSHVWRTPS